MRPLENDVIFDAKFDNESLFYVDNIGTCKFSKMVSDHRIILSMVPTSFIHDFHSFPSGIVTIKVVQFIIKKKT